MLPRPARTPSADTILADVRAHFGLTQWELAGLLLVTPEVYGHYEAGRRRLTTAMRTRLLPLLAALPAAPELLPPPLPAPPPSATAPPAPEPLLARLDYCRHHLPRLRRLADGYARQAQVAARWATAAPGLAGQAPFSTDARATRWLHDRPTALSATDLAAWHLLRVRINGLEAEVAALTALGVGG